CGPDQPLRGPFSYLGAANSRGHLSLASHASRAHVRQPFLGAVALKRMRHFRRLILGSARVSRVWFRRRAETGFHSNVIGSAESNSEEKFAIARRARQHAWTRALPRVSRSHFLVVGAVLPVAVALSLVWLLPIPNALQKSPSGTLTLLDCRARGIATLY